MQIEKIFSAALAISTISMLTANAFAATDSSVDWRKGVITATAIGFPPDRDLIPSQAKKLAEKAAVAEAYRKLAEQVEGVQVTGETTVEKLQMVSAVVKTRVAAVIRGARQVSSREIEDGGYEVTLQMPIYGNANSLAGVVFEKNAVKTPFPNPVPTVAPTKPVYTPQTPVQQRIDVVVSGGNASNVTVQYKSTPVFSNILDYQTKIFFTPEVVVEPLSSINISSLPKVKAPQDTQIVVPTVPQIPQGQVQVPTVPQTSTQQVPQITAPPVQQNLSSDAEIIGGYTGIIIDCRGMELQAVMSPVIKNENKETIYGDKNLDYDKIVEMGMAAYSDGVDNLDRAGQNPIVVKAVALDNFKSNPVLSVADSNRVLLENKSTHFLDNMNVVFLQ